MWREWIKCFDHLWRIQHAETNVPYCFLIPSFLYCYSLYQLKVLATGQNMDRAQMTWQLPTLQSRVLTEKLLAVQLMKFPCHLWNLNLHYNSHTKSQLNHILCQMNPTQNFAHSFLKTDFSINPLLKEELTRAKFAWKILNRQPLDTG